MSAPMTPDLAHAIVVKWMDNVDPDRESRLSEAIELVLAEVEKAARACRTLGKIVDRQAVDICRITGVDMPDSGDADFGLAWDRAFGMAAEIERLRERLPAAEAVIKDAEDASERSLSRMFGGDVVVALVADAWDEGWRVGASALTDGYQSGQPNPYRADPPTQHTKVVFARGDVAEDQP